MYSDWSELLFVLRNQCWNILWQMSNGPQSLFQAASRTKLKHRVVCRNKIHPLCTQNNVSFCKCWEINFEIFCYNRVMVLNLGSKLLPGPCSSTATENSWKQLRDGSSRSKWPNLEDSSGTNPYDCQRQKGEIPTMACLILWSTKYIWYLAIMPIILL